MEAAAGMAYTARRSGRVGGLRCRNGFDMLFAAR